ncbi:rhodanese-like domain-containing protein [Fluviibacterium sp. S390]|uniref:rhodanese-like domain-containing protein n=1 Tax=Fluviibacterium sp. S390 TaxID=3415139 RepID=UPI003C79AF24
MEPQVVAAATREIWSAAETADALSRNRISLIDVRSRPEWVETGVAKEAWPISMHEPGCEQRLFAARDFSGEKPIALICATGGRSGRLLSALKRAGYTGFIDVSEGMLGSPKGPGWIARGLPVTNLEAALASLPGALR